MVFQRSQIEEVANHIRSAWKPNPRVGIVLGSGLGASVESMDVQVEFDYGDLPHFPRSTAVGHLGRLLAGELAGLPVIAMQGRFHLYEGYTPQQVTFPIRVMRGLGADLLIVCNAAGGLHSTYAAGDIMAIDDHINMMFQNPLIGINDDRLGPRFPDMSSPYDPALIQQVMQIAREHDFTCHRGVYIGMLGPNYETRAEYRFLRRFGGHVVGMSTVPEVPCRRPRRYARTGALDDCKCCHSRQPGRNFWRRGRGRGRQGSHQSRHDYPWNYLPVWCRVTGTGGALKKLPDSVAYGILI